ncbi:MAG TPA: hypothetical protein VMZ66_11665 [Aeromicrobium sp.]|nr:hypothetical protein [Aeromicrobium sp.]
MRRSALALALACLALVMTGCSADDQPDEWIAHLTISVMKDAKAKEKSAVLICPGRTSHERDVCAALDVVAPRVFQPVPEDRVCTMIYGGPATATIRGTYGDDVDLADASFNQQNGCEIGRWNQILPVLKALKLYT